MGQLLTASAVLMCPHGGKVNVVSMNDSVGLCVAADQAPQGPVMITVVQPRVSGQ